MWRREAQNGSKTADLFPASGCCISRPPDIDRGDGRAMRPLNDRHKKSNTVGVGSDRLLEVLSPRERHYMGMKTTCQMSDA